MNLLTRWGEKLDPDAVLPEYPRPQLMRDSHLSLNGRWDYAILPTPEGERFAARPDAWDGEIIVPFSPETPLSGVQRQLQPDETLWYRRTVTLPEGFRDERTVLHFGAVDQDCVVYVDGHEVGRHEGGFTPFAVRIDPASDVFELSVAVRDVSDTSYRSRGKQRLDRGGIWYTAQSGIWQTVWLEAMPELAVRTLELTPRMDFGDDGSVTDARLDVVVRTWDDLPGTASVVLRQEGAEVSRIDVEAGVAATLPVPDARPWSPEDPFLYDIDLVLGADAVTSYAGMRTFGIGPDAEGTPRLLLNGRPYLAIGLLDQGYWSDGYLTAPSDEALIRDIELAKDLGFTMLRKHIKIEPLRWYHHCDRLGMLVWQDMVNGGITYKDLVITAPAFGTPHIRDSRRRDFGRRDAEGRAEFLREMREAVEHLRSVPSISAWVPFNEGWGQFDANDTAELLRSWDDTRMIDHASGWHDQGGGDVRSLHIYFRKVRMRPAWKDGRRPVVLSEYGGYSLRIADHVTTPKKFGYRRYNSSEELTAAIIALHRDQIAPAIAQGLSATVYTQVSDVEDEDNGLMTYDRRIVKVEEAPVREAILALRYAIDSQVPEDSRR